MTNSHHNSALDSTGWLRKPGQSEKAMSTKFKYFVSHLLFHKGFRQALSQPQDRKLKV